MKYFGIGMMVFVCVVCIAVIVGVVLLVSAGVTQYNRQSVIREAYLNSYKSEIVSDSTNIELWEDSEHRIHAGFYCNDKIYELQLKEVNSQ